jgi:hypothetical protein
MLEEGHGGFDRYTPASVLKKSFDDAMDGLAGPMTELEFYLKLLPLIAEVKDGHTRAQLSADGAGPAVPGKEIGTRFYVSRDKKKCPGRDLNPHGLTAATF